MTRRGALSSLAALPLAYGQQPRGQAGAAPLIDRDTPPEPDFFCPMDKDVRSKDVGKCPRCGMKLIPSIADPVEYPVDLTVAPRPPRAGQPAHLTFRVLDPGKAGTTVRQFELMHEKLFHLFLISEDLSYFAHEHPELQPNGEFRFSTTFPHGGPYRALTDFFPVGGTPQMNAQTLYVAGGLNPNPAPLAPGILHQNSENLRASLTTEPAQPLAGFKTLLFFELEGKAGPLRLEPYLGAWGHMLAASWDLIDMVHTHPFIADGGPKVQFNLIFPRAGIYKVWVQFQNGGVVNTLAFPVQVKPLQ
jgi:hypothetical protein